MVTGLFRLLASPGVLLLATTTTAQIGEHGGGTSSPLTPTGGVAETTDAADGSLEDEAATTFDVGDECSSEMIACGFDETCKNCFSASTSSDEFLPCLTGFTSTTSTSGCDIIMESACCVDDLTDLECLNNESFLEFFGCYLEGVGCSGEITCDDTSSARATATPTSFGYDSTAVVVVGITCAFMVLRPL